MNNRRKKGLLVVLILIIIIILITGIVLILKNEKLVKEKVQLEQNSLHNVIKESNVYNTFNEYSNTDLKKSANAEKEEDSSKYDEPFFELADNEKNNDVEKTIIVINNVKKDATNEIEVTNKDFDSFKTILSYGNNQLTENEIEQKILDYKIYSIEAQKRGLEISAPRLKEIEELSNSEDVLKFITDDPSQKNKFQNRIYSYLLDIEYNSSLKSKILDEISHNKVSIDDEVINQKMQEYIKIEKDFASIENPTDEEKAQSLAKKMSLYYEIENLYLQCIKADYQIEYK